MLPLFQRGRIRREATEGRIAGTGAGWARLGKDRCVFAVLIFYAIGGPALTNARAFCNEATEEPVVVRRVFRDQQQGKNLLKPNAWRAYGKGFVQSDGGVFVCDNAAEAAQRGAVQTVELNQTRPTPIVAFVESAAEQVGGGKDAGYSLYLDLIYQDGTPLWGQTFAFSTGSHDWEPGKVLIFPDQPIQRVSLYLLFRGHTGRALFRNPALHELKAEGSVVRFDGVVCWLPAGPREGFSVRDVAADSDFVAIDRAALGLELDVRRSESATMPAAKYADSHGQAVFYDVRLKDTTGRDRAVTLVYSLSDGSLRGNDTEPTVWCGAPDVAEPTVPDREYLIVSPTQAGTGRGLSRWPVAAIIGGGRGLALGIDMSYPAVYRCGYSTGTGELYAAFDLALTKEKPEATLRLVSFAFEPEWGFRAAWEEYQRLFPGVFAGRLSRHGLWMPFAKISEVPDWQDFGFVFKEGDNETAWDDAHGIVTFRYTEPMTWWMSLPPDVPRTYGAAVAYAENLAGRGDLRALAWRSSVFHDAEGRLSVRLLDTPWCNGAVWSMCSLPQIPGDATDFRLKWSQELRERLYGPNRPADLDGEYIDSSEGYVTDELDFRRDHFVGDRPLTFDSRHLRPAVFRGLIVYEYIRAIAQDVHGMGKYMMANATPHHLCWLVPLLDVAGTETDWNPGGVWRPMGIAELLYRRALCGPKPYCFLQNTEFDKFGAELTEKYMKRSLAFGMFPGFFSADASTGHYFRRPELYERDRPLFRKYIPLCRLLSEAGWQPVTRAKTAGREAHLERFGDRYLTAFHSGAQTRTAIIELTGEWSTATAARDLVSGRRYPVREGRVEIVLDAEDAALLDFGSEP
ncbi:MAG: hypothetical protein ACUVQQ_00435 [Thermogutta sp.]